MVRETLNNAIAHADYSVDGARSHAHMFDDRLIIESPGPWMTGMDADDVRAGHSKTRNRAIARNLHELDYIEERGTFWGKALAAHGERGYPLPEFEEIGHSLRVILPIHPAVTSAPPANDATEPSSTARRLSRQERFDQFEEILKDGPLSTAQVGKRAGISARAARDILLEMQTAGKVQVSDHSPTSPLRVWSVKLGTSELSS